MLQELSILIQYDDDEYHIDISDKSTTLQILGICQEMSGDHQSAYQSYCNALQHKYCETKLASLFRIAVIVHKCVTGFIHTCQTL